MSESDLSIRMLGLQRSDGRRREICLVRQSSRSKPVYTSHLIIKLRLISIDLSASQDSILSEAFNHVGKQALSLMNRSQLTFSDPRIDSHRSSPHPPDPVEETLNLSVVDLQTLTKKQGKTFLPFILHLIMSSKHFKATSRRVEQFQPEGARIT